MGWIFLILIGIFIYFYSASEKSRRKKQYRELPVVEKKPDVFKITLSSEQKALFKVLESTRKNIFVTGKAGTGKSVLLQYFKYKSAKRLVVVAPTGVAALNVGGQTIHSLFRIPPSFIEKDSLRVNYRTATVLRNIDAVVIDEISMVRADLMDAMDSLLRQARSSNVPFGGVQIVTFGDLYQLPPVVDDKELHKYFVDNHGGFYFFNAHCWLGATLDIYELKKVFRQSDEKFIYILDAIRKGKANDNILNKLNTRYLEEIPDDGVITLATTNSSVNSINHRKLDQLDGKEYQYKADIIGSIAESAFPTEEILKFKKGAQVMFLKNDKQKRWVNGTIGLIDSLSKNTIKVNVDGYVYTVNRETWNKIRYTYDQEERKVKEEVVSSFVQYPLRLAWAVTIHKSQGQTYSSIVVDMGGGAFAHGQTYVGLSRCKSLDGLFLKRPIEIGDVSVDPSVVEFMQKAKFLEY